MNSSPEASHTQKENVRTNESFLLTHPVRTTVATRRGQATYTTLIGLIVCRTACYFHFTKTHFFVPRSNSWSIVFGWICFSLSWFFFFHSSVTSFILIRNNIYISYLWMCLLCVLSVLANHERNTTHIKKQTHCARGSKQHQMSISVN